MVKRALTAMTILVVGAVAGTTATGYAAPPDPTPGATKPVREQNLDDDGFIRVHEQGIADVNVTNEELNVNVTNDNLTVSGEVEVSNFPATQDVNVVGGSVGLPPVTAIESTPLSIDPIPAGESVTHSIPLINAVSFNVAENFDEYSLFITGPLGTPLHIESGELIQETYFYTFIYPVPIDSITIFCENESDDCFIDATLSGFEV